MRSFPSEIAQSSSCARIKELCWLIELGGSKKWSVQKAEKELQTQVDALKDTLKIPKAKT